MTDEHWGRLRPEALRALRLLVDLIADPDTEPERALQAYLDAKARLAQAFQALTLERMSDSAEGFGSAVARLNDQMEVSYKGVVPDKYLRVRGFRGVHQELFAYLSRRVGQAVSAPELRVITGDAVHTERRVRELRDLGFEVVAAHSGGADTYKLTSTIPDFSKGALQIVRLNVKSDRSISTDEQTVLLETIGLKEQ